MKKSTKVFVSYTIRDGQVTPALLNWLHENLEQVCHPFIHRVSPTKHRDSQFVIIRELLRSHLLLLIESPAVYHSPWVKLELLISRLKFMPVIKLPVRQIEGPTANGVTH